MKSQLYNSWVTNKVAEESCTAPFILLFLNIVTAWIMISNLQSQTRTYQCMTVGDEF